MDRSFAFFILDAITGCQTCSQFCMCVAVEKERNVWRAKRRHSTASLMSIGTNLLMCVSPCLSCPFGGIDPGKVASE
jgi:hypothetical protein